MRDASVMLLSLLVWVSARADDPVLSAPPRHEYRSVLADYVPSREGELEDWREANARVTPGAGEGAAAHGSGDHHHDHSREADRAVPDAAAGGSHR